MSYALIRPAEPADTPAITAIYNDVIARSTAVYADDPVDLAERKAQLATRRAQGYPVLAAVEVAGKVVGFASFGDFRAWPGYRFTVEHSVHVRADRWCAGVGCALVAALFPLARALGNM